MNIPQLHGPHSRIVVVSEHDILSNPVLSEVEKTTYNTYTGIKKVNWLLGRMAGKEALRDYLSHYSPDYQSDSLCEIRVVAPAVLPSCLVKGVEQTTLLLSLSHTKGRYGAAIVASGTVYAGVGIDIELIRDFTPSLVEGFCTPAEYHYWTMLPTHEQAVVATAFWTLKEAYIKALRHDVPCHPRHFDSLVFILNPTSGVAGTIQAKWTVLKNDSILAVLYITPTSHE